MFSPFLDPFLPLCYLLHNPPGNIAFLKRNREEGRHPGRDGRNRERA